MPKQPAHFDPDQDERLGFVVKQLYQQLRNAVEARVRASGIGLSMPHAVALYALMREPGLSGADLARLAMVTPQTMHGILSRLEVDGIIERRPHPGHGRILMTTVTAKGRRLVRRGSGIADAVMEEAQAGLDDGQRTQLMALMRHCLDNLLRLQPPGAKVDIAGRAGKLPVAKKTRRRPVP